jgi:DNA-binding beta-propeller fold protein YncE
MKRTVLIRFVLVGVLLVWVIPQLFKPVIEQAASIEAPHLGGGGLPQFRVDPNFPKIPAKWRMGFGVNVAVDADDNVWILSRPGSLAHPTNSRRSPADLPPDLISTPPPPVMEFDNNGNFIRGWGGESGPGYRWPSLEHGMTVDSKGFVWIVGNADGAIDNPAGLPTDNQILKFTKDGKFVMAIGKSGQTGSNASDVLSGADGLAYYAKTNELFVSDGDGNSRVMVYDGDTGKLKRMWGAYGNKPLDMDARPAYPGAKGICPVCSIGSGHLPALQQFAQPHAVTVSSDGLVYVCDKGNKRIQVFTTEGKFIAEQFLGMDIQGEEVNSAAFSPDERFLYVLGTPISYILNRRTLEFLGTFSNPGNPLHTNHMLAVDHKGNLYTANFQTEPIGKVEGVGAYKLMFNGYSPRTPCPPCQSTKSAVQ